MQFINDFIRSQADSQAARANYGMMGTIGQAMMILAVVFYFIRMKAKILDIVKGVLIGAIAYYFCIYAQHFMMWYRSGFALDHYNQIANIAVAFTVLPLVMWLSAKAFNVPFGYAGDIASLAMLGFHMFGRSGCIFTGCCYGFACDWGLYSRQTGANQFPVCLVESLFTLAIFVFVIVRICRKDYKADGKTMAWFLLLYGCCRFISETTRDYTRDYWLVWRFSDIHIHMLAMASVGGFLLWKLIQKERAAAAGEGPSLPTLKGVRK